MLRFYSWFYLMMTRAGRNMFLENKLQQGYVWRHREYLLYLFQYKHNVVFTLNQLQATTQPPHLVVFFSVY
jgi:hypothetical protein